MFVRGVILMPLDFALHADLVQGDVWEILRPDET